MNKAEVKVLDYLERAEGIIISEKISVVFNDENTLKIARMIQEEELQEKMMNQFERWEKNRC